MTVIAIQLCTYRRPQVVETLASLARQRVPGADLHLFVIDNDETESARDRVVAAAERLPFGYSYLHAPARNIAIARNACLDAAGDADWIASIDDDEIAPEGWLARLFARATDSGADGVFGPIRAAYPLDAPKWMRDLAPHSRSYGPRQPHPRTGNTGNALLRWRGAPWQDRRFDPLRGRTGGEDIAFFSALHDMGARFAIAPDAEVVEPVERHRLQLEWLAHRRFRTGQSHVAVAGSRLARSRLGMGGLLLSAAVQAACCQAMQFLTSHNEARRNHWFLRRQQFRGTCAGLMGREERLFHSRPDP
ncbi:glycosyltransferase family 2 protein [Paracoccus sp. DMF-8]|uniref:glycosyltransferase n=1 Tax=Paracoccus sp. DMF-8 TaxID=3019445 RepID=UPI0023E85FB3|nr:glycosyltransferase family 2 protein [Paracoccus sp. DMF-8]MDF3606796.1 glycosyltransferase family 2 protein [Paracoccus sp. DMF-8]